jgi:hypothetical protein
MSVPKHRLKLYVLRTCQRCERVFGVESVDCVSKYVQSTLTIRPSQSLWKADVVFTSKSALGPHSDLLACHTQDIVFSMVRIAILVPMHYSNFPFRLGSHVCTTEFRFMDLHEQYDSSHKLSLSIFAESADYIFKLVNLGWRIRKKFNGTQISCSRPARCLVEPRSSIIRSKVFYSSRTTALTQWEAHSLWKTVYERAEVVPLHNLSRVWPGRNPMLIDPN